MIRCPARTALAVSLLTAATLASCSPYGPGKPRESSSATGGTGVVRLPLEKAVDQLKEAPEKESGSYRRSAFPHWSDDDQDGCNTRYEVLIAASETEPEVKQPGCELTGGRWTAEFDGTVLTDPSETSIDHMVPLAEAWRSGAFEWDKDRRRDFANDLAFNASLAVMTPRQNSQKSDQGPGSWLPEKDVCQYAADWTAVKLRWHLTADPRETGALKELEKCGRTPVEYSDFADD